MIHTIRDNMHELALRRGIRDMTNSIKEGSREGSDKSIIKELDKNKTMVMTIDQDSEFRNNLMTIHRFPIKNGLEDKSQAIDKNQRNFMNTDSFHNRLRKELLQIDGEFTVKEAINIAYHTRAAQPDRFYGILLSKEGIKMNPLHPLVAMNLQIADDQEKYKLYIFSFPKGSEKLGRIKDLSIIEANIADQIALFSEDLKVTHSMKIANSERNMIDQLNHGSEIEVRIVEEMLINGVDANKIEYLIPHQVLNHRTMVPYYGSSIVLQNKNAEPKGYHITPMMSPNIGSPLSGEHILNNNAIRGRSVCTGSISKTTVGGMRTLNHANQNSPYWNDILAPGWRDYADMCVEYSFLIYQDMIDGYEDTTIKEKIEELSYYEQWIKDNPNKIMSDYFTHLKERQR